MPRATPTNKWQEMVMDFHIAMNMPHGEIPFARRKLRAALILEEALETIEALGFSVEQEDDGSINVSGNSEVEDTVAVVDGLCDILYVTLGCAVEMGLDIDPLFTEVHRSNMAKVGGEVREDGKRLKPKGWRPPNLKPFIDAQIKEI